MNTNRMGLEQTLSDERLEQISNEAVSAERIAMARELLAYRKASKEPVGYVDSRPAAHGGISWAANRLALDRGTKLYAAPPLQAVTVPDELLSSMEEVIRISDREHEAWSRAKANIKHFRDAMPKSVTNEP